MGTQHPHQLTMHTPTINYITQILQQYRGTKPYVYYFTQHTTKSHFTLTIKTPTHTQKINGNQLPIENHQQTEQMIQQLIDHPINNHTT